MQGELEHRRYMSEISNRFEALEDDTDNNVK